MRTGDIRRRHARNVRSEYFFVWPGHEDNVVVVLGVDRAIHQVMLMVHEPRRDIFESIPGRVVRADELAVLPGDDRRVYARGAVRHPDHRTLRLARWRRVLSNREVDEGGSLFGGRWID